MKGAVLFSSTDSCRSQPERMSSFMKSLRTVYIIGNGPSSSHTVGPYSAARLYKSRYPEADAFEVTLFGSLAFTGEGHGTGKAIQEAIPEAVVIFNRDIPEDDLPHPNTMLFTARKNGEILNQTRIFSIGGGAIRIEGETSADDLEVYPEKDFSEMLAFCREHRLSLKDFVYTREEAGLKDALRNVWHAMEASVERGLQTEGIMPGGLGISRKAKMLYEKRCYNEGADITMNRLISSYAYAACEENACGNIVVTAPTCGSCGVIPGILYYMRHDRGFPEEEILDALAVAGLVGNVIRTNASISGAEAGCQAEIGSACSMAAAGLASLYGLSNDEIEYSAEIAMEHNLGLTCDPVGGLVQIPCIERNAVACMRAINCVNLARFLYQTRKVSFDEVIATMYQTGKDLNEKYRETSHGGLALMYHAEHDQPQINQ